MGDRDNLEYMFKPYKALGGNGTGEELYNRWSGPGIWASRKRGLRYDGFWHSQCSGNYGGLLSGGMACKASAKVKDEVIPVVCGVTGGILGVVGMYVMPDFPAADVINAAAIGIVSGLAATGVHQVVKQASKA